MEFQNECFADFDWMVTESNLWQLLAKQGKLVLCSE